MGRLREILERLAKTVQIRHVLVRQGLAECLGTLVLVVFGCGAVAQWVLSRGSHGSFLSVNLAFGFAVTVSIWMCGQVSGGHLNPAVTLALCLLGKEPWRKFPVFCLLQTLGAFLGAAIVFVLYLDALLDFNQGELSVVGQNATAGIFATYPSSHLNLLNGFLDQVVGTAALILGILAIDDRHNHAVPRGLEAFAVGLVVLVIGLSMGFNCGYAVNPARDLGPRAFTALAGWGSEVFTTHSYWSLVPVCAPFLGAVVGVLVYQLMIGYHLECEEEKKKRKKKQRREEDEEEEDTFRTAGMTTNDTA